MRDNKISIYTRRSLENSYSCILYLKKALEKYTETELWSNTDTNHLSDCYRNNCFCFKDMWYGKSRALKLMASKIQCLLSSAKGDQLLIVHDLDFIIPAYLAKKLNAQLKVIHYNTEIHGKDVPYPKYIIKFYEKHANYPDVILECLAERADYRKREFNIKKEIQVINNTLPLNQEGNSKIEIDESKLKFKEDLPILVYAGGCNRTRGIGEIIKSMSDLEHTCNCLMFLYGNETEINNVAEECSMYVQKGMCHIYPSVDRETLFEYMKKCDIGLNYYQPSVSINHMYASPSKFFEYMSLGLKTISTNNTGINNIINSEKIGVCIGDNETLSAAIKRLINDKTIRSKEEIKKVFAEKYCYEVDSKDAIEAILREL